MRRFDTDTEGNENTRVNHRPPYYALVLISLLLVGVTLPRFDREDWVPLVGITAGGANAREHLADAEHYINDVRWFRGEIDSGALRAPFSQRPLAPLLASVLPFRPITALNVVGVAALVVGLWFIYFILLEVGLSRRAGLWGATLWSVSFPVFYYGAVGCVDPVSIGLSAAATWAIMTRRWVATGALLVAGLFAKETFIVVVPFLGAALVTIHRFSWRRALAWTVVATAVGVSVMQMTHLIPAGPGGVHGWSSSIAALVANGTRPRAWISFLLGLGIPGLLAVGWIATYQREALERRQILLPFVVGFLASVGLAGFAFLSAYADGRFIWTGYPFTIPLGLAFLERRAR